MQVNSPTYNTAAAGTTAGNDSSTKKTTQDSLSDPLTQKSTFLKLLVAQMKYQDPTNPTDSMSYLQQLSTYSQLEQMLDMNKELASFHSDIKDALTKASTTDTTGGK